MWPKLLDMTQDECRLMLRNYELETYSKVISTLRAQGALNETKTRLLSDLRNVLQISQERHRVEARRVAYDEKLYTIAETIAGPNTHQQWSREGRREYPLLPRVPPLTALALAANNAKEKASKENAELPYPSETARTKVPKYGDTTADTKNVVLTDPIKASYEERKNLKRLLPFTEHLALIVPELKKRTIRSTSSGKASQPQVHSALQIPQLYQSHPKTQARNKKCAVGANKRANAASKLTAAGQKSNGGTPSKASHKNTKLSPPGPLPPEHLIPGSSHAFSTSLSSNIGNIATANMLSPKSGHTYASSPQPTPTGLPAGTITIDGKVHIDLDSPMTKWPQIATSKKDITNNLSKLNAIPSTSRESQQPVAYTALEGEKIVLQKQKLVEGMVKNLNENVSWNAKMSTVGPISTHRLKGNTTVMAGKHVKLQPHHSTGDHQVIGRPSNAPPMLLSNATSAASMTGRLLERELLSPTGGGFTKIFSSADAASRLLSGSINSNIIIPQSKQIVGKIQSQTIQNSPSTVKPKIQITSNQLISPATTGNLKLQQNVQLKNIQQRKSVKIFSSASGKMFIQSADGPKQAVAKVISQKLSAVPMGATTATGGSATIPSGQRISVQKVQVLQPPGGSSGAIGSTVTLPIGSNPKAVTLNKSSLVFMPSLTTATNSTNAGNMVFRGIPLMRNNNNNASSSSRAITTSSPNANVVADKVLGGEVPYTSNILLKNQQQNNFIVIGALPSDASKNPIIIKDSGGASDASAPNNQKAGNIYKNHQNRVLNQGNMITEDTPVDILPSPPALSNLESPTTITLSPKDIGGTPQIVNLKSSNVSVMQTLPPGSLRKYQLHKNSAQIVANSKPIQMTALQTKLESQGATTSDGNNIAMNSTDWEMELDQEAHKSREKISFSSRSAKSLKDQIDRQQLKDILEGNGNSTNNMDFNDVIEEDTIDDDNMIMDENTTENDDDVEFVVSYGTQEGEEIDENASFEYVEEAPTSSDEIFQDEQPATTVTSTRIKKFAKNPVAVNRSISQSSKSDSSSTNLLMNADNKFIGKAGSNSNSNATRVLTSGTFICKAESLTTLTATTASAPTTLGVESHIIEPESADVAAAAEVLFELQELDVNAKYRKGSTDPADTNAVTSEEPITISGDVNENIASSAK